jgi:hypothetical protein
MKMKREEKNLVFERGIQQLFCKEDTVERSGIV